MSSNKYKLNPDYVRAVRMLSAKIHCPMDLVKFWSISGPCREVCPEIEKMRKDSF